MHALPIQADLYIRVAGELSFLRACPVHSLTEAKVAASREARRQSADVLIRNRRGDVLARTALFGGV